MMDPHEKLLPISTYAPWNEDRDFLETYEAIKESTLIDKYRCYELWSLVEQSAKLEGALLEVGVWRGGSGMLIAKQAMLLGLKETVYLCDTFTGVVKVGANDPGYHSGEMHDDATIEMVEELQKKLKVSNTLILKGIFPDETGHHIPDTKFRLCHIDVDIYASAKGVVDWVWERLVVGGMLIFDDYGFPRCEGITRYVNEFKEFRNLHFLYNLNGHAILIKHR